MLERTSSQAQERMSTRAFSSAQALEALLEASSLVLEAQWCWGQVQEVRGAGGCKNWRGADAWVYKEIPNPRPTAIGL